MSFNSLAPVMSVRFYSVYIFLMSHVFPLACTHAIDIISPAILEPLFLRLVVYLYVCFLDINSYSLCFSSTPCFHVGLLYSPAARLNARLLILYPAHLHQPPVSLKLLSHLPAPQPSFPLMLQLLSIPCLTCQLSNPNSLPCHPPFSPLPFT